MNIVNIAINGDVAIFDEFLELFNVKDITEEETIIIYTKAPLEIQRSFYRKFHNPVSHLVAVKYSKLDLERVDVGYHVDQNQDLLLEALMKGLVRINYHHVNKYADAVIKVLEPHMLYGDTIRQCYHSLIRVLDINPSLSFMYEYEFDEHDDLLNIKALSVLIKHNRVIYHNMIIRHSLIDKIRKVKEYLPDYTIPSHYLIASNNNSLTELYNAIILGLIPANKSYPYDIVLDRHMCIECINYIDNVCIVATYINTGWDELLPYMKPANIDIILCNEKNIEAMHSLGSEYWIACNSIFIECSLIGLSKVSMLMLKDINDVKEMEMDIVNADELIILLHYFNDSVSHPLCFGKPEIDLLSYKEGALRFWKLYHTNPNCVMFYCNHMPWILPILDPPIPNRYYKFMTPKLIAKISKIPYCNKGDIIIVTHE